MNIQQLLNILVELNLLKGSSKNYSKITRLFAKEATTFNIEQAAKLLEKLKGAK